MSRKRIGAVLGALALASLATAQDLVPKGAPQTRPVVVRGATLHPVSGPVRTGAVRFAAGRITHVGEAPAAEGEEIVDGSGLHLYPGFVSAWTQLGLNEIGSVAATQDMDEVGALTPEASATTAVNPDSWLFPVTRKNGVLTAVVAPTGGVVPGRAGVVRLDGWTNDDMALRADAGLVVTWPRMRAGGGGRFRRGPPAAEPEGDPADDVRRAVAVIDDLFRDAEEYFAARKIDPARPVDVRLEGLRSCVAPAEAASRRPVFVLANDHDQIQAAVAFGARRGLKLVIVGGYEADLCAELLKRHDVPVILNGVFRLPKRADAAYDEAFTRPKKLEELGVRWCLASGEETPHERNLPYGAGLAAAYGLAPETALRAITLSAAEIVGVADAVGSLDAGKEATLFLSDGDPLRVPTKIRRAWIAGRETRLTDKQEALFEKYRLKYAGR
jgi:imidazolonepropionase-like amidohydrolase